MTANQEIVPEFSRPIDVSELGDDEIEHRIAAEPAERAALARRFGLMEVGGLTATVWLRRMAGGAVRVRADFVADVVQSCVLTLQPVPVHVAEAFSVDFAPPPAFAPGAEIELSLEAGESPEPLVGRHIDIGETVAQYMALALDPYPKAPGARFEWKGRSARSETAANRPFAPLAKLAKKQRG